MYIFALIVLFFTGFLSIFSYVALLESLTMSAGEVFMIAAPLVMFGIAFGIAIEEGVKKDG